MRKASLSLWIAVSLLGAGLVACGDDGGGGGGDDAGVADGGREDGGRDEPDSSTGTACENDTDCDDGNVCTGTETCNEGVCEAGTMAGDGTECDADGDETTRDLCVEGACGASRCGDAFVDDTASEECDDGNDVNGDGCDDCRFSCDEAADCDDSNDCNGAETCSDAHVCEPGTAADDGTECAGGVGECTGGVCLARSCTTAADCDDANVCNGEETCDATMGCQAGTSLDCDDGDSCTADSCDGTSGCAHALIDSDLDGFAPTSAGACGLDCDDARSDVNPDAPDVCDGRDNDCDGMVDEGGVTTWYADCDRDGYAAMGARTVESCTRPAAGMSMCATGGGWTTRAPSSAAARDCNDANATVNPGQTMFQTTAISGAPAASDYDYNCDSMEEVRSGGQGECRAAGLGCAVTQGWEGDTVPACGATADWIVRCEGALGSCNPVTEERQQACR